MYQGDKGRHRIVYRRSKGKWVNKRPNSRRVTGVHRTQMDAIREATQNLVAEGGGELTIFGPDLRIRSKDTIRPGHNLFSPRDMGH